MTQIFHKSGNKLGDYLEICVYMYLEVRRSDHEDVSKIKKTLGGVESTLCGANSRRQKYPQPSAAAAGLVRREI